MFQTLLLSKDCLKTMAQTKVFLKYIYGWVRTKRGLWVGTDYELRTAPRTSQPGGNAMQKKRKDVVLTRKYHCGMVYNTAIVVSITKIINIYRYFVNDQSDNINHSSFINSQCVQ